MYTQILKCSNNESWCTFKRCIPSAVIPAQVLEAQRRHQKEKSGIIPTSPTPYTYNKVRPKPVELSISAYCGKYCPSNITTEYLLYVIRKYRSSELWLVVSRCDHLRDAVWLSSVLLQAPQSHHPEGHEEENYDGQLWLSWRWVEPDFGDGQGHCTQVSHFHCSCSGLVTSSCCTPRT